MINFIKEIVKNDSFFKLRKNIKIKPINKLTNKMFPSTTSFDNATKLLSQYDKNGTREKILLTYTIKQNKGTSRNPVYGTAKGFQLYVKIHHNLYVILDRRESGKSGAGQLILRYIDGEGKKQGSVKFHSVEKLFDGLSGNYDKELETLTIEHNIDSESTEAVRDIFIF